MKKCPHVKVGESSPWSLLFFGLATAGLFKVGMFLIWLASYERKKLWMRIMYVVMNASSIIYLQQILIQYWINGQWLLVFERHGPSAPLPPVHHVPVEDGDDDDVCEAQRHCDLHEHGRDTKAGALLGVSTEFRDSFTIFGYTIRRGEVAKFRWQLRFPAPPSPRPPCTAQTPGSVCEKYSSVLIQIRQPIERHFTSCD